ncbi:DedA family protein [Oerskovia turbata]|uniref:DedA family protein n=1 Tax=Oerskovia turbata TaxID=1713 RepID=A0A4Q1L1Y8_9CELL|nr:DedA family protein [Oerskovia turbata]RXR36822.1 DedA family protein [Oerskovia turbata]TGJ98065.1 DedA family protein [Actinotalea fermentans ATCC 43279 = JCM 9966 = DSM 3133]
MGPTASLASAPHLAQEVVTAADGSTGIFTIDGVPYWIIYAAAFAIVFVRAQATYWVGRGVARGTGNTRWAQRLEGERAQRAIATINRWGPIAVTLSFFTVGVQTVINLTAGYTRMRLPRYLAALLPGCAIWAAIWTTVGIAAFNTAVLLAAGSPVGLAVLVLLVVGLVAWILVASRRRRARAAQGDQDAATLASPSGRDDGPAATEATDAPPRTTGSNPFGDVADLLLEAPDEDTNVRRTHGDTTPDPSATPTDTERG